MSGKLSILISCYNQRDFIGQAIRSFFEQDYENREIIVLDDGSSDDSMAVIASAAAEAPCPVLYLTQSNHGVSYTFRRLAEMASGDYLMFMGGDDFVPPNSLKSRIEKLESNDNLMFAGGLTRYVNGDTIGDWFIPSEKVMKLNELSVEKIFDSIKGYVSDCVRGIVLTACIIRKKDYVTSGGLSADMICDDSILFYNLFRHAVENNRSLVMVPDLVFYYRQHENNTSKDPEAMWVRFSELHNKLGFNTRRQASFSAYATYMKAVRRSGKWYQKELLKRIFSDRAVIKYLTFGAICRDLLFPRFGRF